MDDSRVWNGVELPHGFALAAFEGLALRRRDRLVSALLADRSVLRVISAPHGFGKSCLAYEYARRLFGRADVRWVDASGPEFLQALDGATASAASAGRPDLIVLDDLAFLDERRARTLSERIDRLLYEGVEIVATTLPSNDCLSSLQPDRMLLTASDLLVTEKECRRPDGAASAELPRAQDTWAHARTILFGTTPAALWGSFTIAQQRCLEGFLDENLPGAMVRAALGMMLLGSGDFDDLAAMGLALSAEEEQMLFRDYPFLGADAYQRTFDVPEFPLEALAQACASSHAAETLVGGTVPLPQKAVSLCLRRGDVRRVSDMLACFFSDEQCAGWLLESGWDLLDRGEAALVDTLLERTPPQMLRSDPGLVALKAWCCGLTGAAREAQHHSQRILRAADDAGESALMAYLALLLFAGEPSSLYGKRPFAPEVLATPFDLLAAVVDLCEEAELVRAFGLWRNDGDDAYGRADCEPERAEAVRDLLTANEDRFGGTAPFRIALHLLQYLDSIQLRVLLQDLGCATVVEVRRTGVSRYTEAVLMADLWRSGFFGVSGRSVDVRDARILDAAATLLEQLGVSICDLAITPPWDNSPLAARIGGGTQGRLQRNPQIAERFPPLRVNLFGGIEVTLGDQPLPESKFRRKSLLLLVILVINQGRDVSREALLEELWPTLDRKHALDNFYTCWSNLMDFFANGPYLVRTEGFCRADSRYVASDAAEFEQLSRRLLTGQDSPATLLDVYARLEALYKGELMPAERKCTLILSQRERFKTMFVDAMVAGTAQALAQHDNRVALWFARKARDVDPHREDVYQKLIEAQVAAGQRCSAIRTYFECREFLNSELGLDPSVEVQELYDRLITVDPSLLRLEPASFR